MSKLKPYPKYKPIAYDYISQLPEEWELLPNIAIFQERIERGFENEELLSVTIAKGVIRQGELDKKDSSTLDKSKYLLVHPNDLVYSMRFRQGASGYSIYKGIVSPACTVLKPKKENKINPRFFFYMFRTEFYKNYVARFSYGIADGQIPLRYVDFKRMYSIVPSLAEQNAIVAYLDAKTQQIQDFITKKQKLIQLLEEKKTAVIHRLITQGIQKNKELVETEIKWFDKIPKHWELKKLKFVVSKVKTGTTPSSRKDYFDKEEFNWFTPSDFNNQFELISSSKKINFNAVKDGEVSVFPKDSVLMIGIGGTLGKVGIIKENSSSNQQINSITFNTQLLPEYGLYLLDFMGKELLNILDYTTLPILNQLETKRLPFLKPPLQEQKEIVDIIKKISDEITQAITQAQKEIEKLQEYQESLISHLVTGQLQVPVA